jgi:hypothetical protein
MRNRQHECGGWKALARKAVWRSLRPAHAPVQPHLPLNLRPPNSPPQEGCTTIAIEIVALHEELDTADVLRAIKHKIRKDFIVISGDLGEYVYVCMCHKCVRVSVGACVYIHTRKNTYTYIYVFIYVHIFMHTNRHVDTIINTSLHPYSNTLATH